MTNKKFCTFFTLIILFVYHIAVANDNDDRLIFHKKIIILNNMTTGQKSMQVQKKCTISLSGESRVQLFFKRYNKDKDTVSTLSDDEKEKLEKVFKNISLASKDNFSSERDFTGNDLDNVGQKHVKDDLGIIKYHGKEYEFYKQRRRLLRFYNGEGADFLIKLTRKYCKMFY